MANTRETYQYTDDKNVTHPISLTDEVKTAAGFTQAASSSAIWALVHKNEKKRSLGARGVRLRRTTGSGSSKKIYYRFLPIPTLTRLNQVKIGDAFTLGSTAWTVHSIVAEDYA